MARKKTKKKKGKGKRKAQSTRPTSITIRHEATMARKSNKKGKGHGRKGGHHGRKKNSPRRRRRNPDFTQRLVSLLGGAGVALGTGVLVTLGAGKIMPGSNVTLYGIPAAAFLAGVALSGKMPTIGAGMALGAVGPFTIPLASRLLSATQPSATTTATATAKGLRAVEMRGLGAVEMGDYMTPHESYEYAG